MNNHESSKSTSQWNIKKKNIIEETAVLINPYDLAITNKLTASLSDDNRAKSIGNDYFLVSINKSEANKIVDILVTLEVEALDTSKEEASRIAHILDEWNKANWE